MSDEYGKPNIVISRFWTDHESVNGGQTVKEIDYCEVAKRGSTAVMANKIARWKQDNWAIWAIIEPAYLAWKKGESEMPVDGTPLEAWPAITSKGMIDHLKILNIRTVEHLALATSADAERIGMGATRLITLARAFVESKNGSSAVTAALAERDTLIQRQQLEIDDLRSTVKQLAAALAERDTLIQRQQAEIDDLRRTVEQLAAAMPKSPSKPKMTPMGVPSESN